MDFFKRLGQRLIAQTFERQVVHVRVGLLNRFTALGTPIRLWCRPWHKLLWGKENLGCYLFVQQSLFLTVFSQFGCKPKITLKCSSAHPVHRFLTFGYHNTLMI